VCGDAVSGSCIMGFPLGGCDDPCEVCGATSDATCGRWVTAADQVVRAARAYIIKPTSHETFDALREAVNAIPKDDEP
jgi:hypothetical protein